MRLTFKLVLWFLASVIIVVGVNAYFGVRSEVSRYEAEVAEPHTVMGRVLRDAFRERVRSDGEEKAVSMLEYMDKQKADVRIETRRGARTDVVKGDASRLQQIVTNLFMNAVHAMPQGGKLAVDIDDVEATPPADRGEAPGAFLRVRVRDEGVGIASDLLPHVFEPFVTTKEVGEGTGLGLSVCYGIARDHNGWIDVESEVGHGSTFSVFLPKGTS
jgi:two-component system, NtrC family, sensor kinase